MIMKGTNRIACLVLTILLLPVFPAMAETIPEDTEQGLEEIQPLLEMTDVQDQEGMSLEEMTDAFTESAMSEYYDIITGFSMQYPSIFTFDEELQGSSAATDDRKATLTIDNMENQGGLDEESLRKAIKLENPDADIRKNEQNGCLRVDRVTEDGTKGRTDLYLLTDHSFHHIILCYPAEDQGTYFAYIEYMINTMETNDTDLG